ncbi:MAG: PaaI family thioesterase [Alphaproteobacteria bacterium]|nr:PaaI family thioesterase [Alphaproteobacteria bacterium]
MKHERTYRWADPTEIMAAAQGQSGLDLMRAMAEGRVPPPPVGSLIGVNGFTAEKGKVTMGFDPAEFHYNALGTVHGGVIATVIDMVLGSAVHSTLKAGQGFTTLTLELKYHRAVTAKSGRLTAVAEVVTRGREIVTAEAKLIDKNDRLFANATSTLMILKLPNGA